MKTPPLLLGMALLFWGWQTKLLAVAVILAAVLEGSRLLRVRWEFSQTDFNRIWNLCSILFLGAMIIAFAAHEGASGVAGFFETVSMAKRSDSLNKTARSVLALFQWMPMIFYPIMVSQAFSSLDRMDLSTFSWILRRLRLKQAPLKKKDTADTGINVSFPYFAICLLASSATNQRAIWSYIVLAGLLAWALWPSRNRRFSWAVWGALLVVTVAIGYAGHNGLFRLQKALENLDSSFLSSWFKQETDFTESRTKIGSIGQLKLSGRIVLRLETDGQPPPSHLREASFDAFNSPSLWSASRKEFTSVVSENDNTTWTLLPGKSSLKSVKVGRYLHRGAGLLALPNGVSELRDLPVFLLDSNRLGVLRVRAGPGLVRYQAQYDDGPTIDSPPESNDTLVPPDELMTISQVADELGLSSMSATQALNTVATFFQNNFQYSTYLDSRPHYRPRQTALASFLLKRRKGHCEYFATATVLLLRQAGIPARYAAGYSVQEGSGRKFLVRERHAHAWCLAYIDGTWRDFDTTPPSWNEVESKNASFWEPLSDAWSRLWFEFSKWRWSKIGFRKYLLWLVFPLAGLLAARLFFKRQWSRRQQQAKIARPEYPGLDSEFYLVEKRLAVLGLERRAGEPLRAWLDRIEPAAPAAAPLLRKIVSLHYRHRFDPAGLSAADRRALKTEVETWLEQHPVSSRRLAPAGT